LIKSAIKATLGKIGYQISRVPSPDAPSVYVEDGIRSEHCHDFIEDQRFVDAYQTGKRAMGAAYHPMHWRAHVLTWCGRQCSTIAGDFVECGVSHGFMSAMLMQYLDWDSLGKTFWLLDTFAGIDPRYLTEAERKADILKRNQSRLETREYATNLSAVRATFAAWGRVKIVVGSVPETLPQVSSEKIAFLHIDMNNAVPERAAIEYFWDRLTPGAFVVLDDYGWRSFEPQKHSMDEFAASRCLEILRVPTGQGVMYKPVLATGS
jgi:hypothetical protein